MERISFTEETREAVATEAQGRGLVLVMEQNHFDGDFLLYGTALEASGVDAEAAQISLAASDKDMARGVEDLYQALIAKGVIDDIDLPVDFRDKVQARAVFRSRL